MTKIVGGLRIPELGDGNDWPQHLENLATDLTGAYAPFLAGESALQRTLLKIAAGIEDVNILILGDSTGDGLVTTPDEWGALLPDRLATLFPTHTIDERLWVHASTDYDPATEVAAGTGSRTITVWNGSAAGRTTTYHLAYWQNSVIQANPDLVIVSHGHNEEDHTTTAKREMFYGRYLALTESVRQAFPSAGIVCIAQPPDLANDYQAERAAMIRDIAAERGYGFADVHQAFLASETALADLIDPDGVHPNAAGHAIWIDLIERLFAVGYDVQPRTQLPPALDTVAPINLARNGDFARWDGTVPDDWTAGGSLTVAKDTVNYETVGYSAKLTTTADGATQGLTQNIYSSANDVKWLAGRWVTLMMRFTKSAGGTGVGLCNINDGVSVSTSRGVAQTPDGFVWQVVTKKIDPAATLLQIGFYSGGFNGDEISCNRVLLIPGRQLADIVPTAPRPILASSAKVKPTGNNGFVSIVNGGTGSPLHPTLTAQADIGLLFGRYNAGGFGGHLIATLLNELIIGGFSALDTEGAVGKGTFNEVVAVDRSGKIGFFGANPVVKPSVLLAADSSTVDSTYGAEEAAVINNIRTRLNSLEAKLQSLGLLA